MQASNPNSISFLDAEHPPARSPLRVLFVVEGYTDIRFVTGISEICDLTMVVPARQYHESGLDQRILNSGAKIRVDELAGGRLQYQAACFNYLRRNARKFDVILSQELLRGSLDACLIGWLYKKPVVIYITLPHLEYFRCRRLRGQQSWIQAKLGETVMRTLIWTTSKLATRCVAIGPYLVDVASRHSNRVSTGYYYGVDTRLYRPASEAEKLRLRATLDLPAGKFLILSGSRISHEKDPETVLRAVSLARAQGLDAVVLNLGGGYQDFLRLARELSLSDAEQWVLGRPAVHPMQGLADYYRASDALAQGSLDEGAGMTPLEALACAVPAVCTAVGGMARIAPDYVRLTPRRDADAMANEFLWIASHRGEALAQAKRGREFIEREWNRERAFSSLRDVLTAAARGDREIGN
ncbi:MAG: glycosyltransferase family 4 protein [Bryobacterales bacterium]|nr:glycosyltransferase family 4 protein [Bryobacterales bacterium]